VDLDVQGGLKLEQLPLLHRIDSLAVLSFKLRAEESEKLFDAYDFLMICWFDVRFMNDAFIFSSSTSHINLLVVKGVSTN
jgi:hypothetical protein